MTSQNELLQALETETEKKWNVRERINTGESARMGKERQEAGDKSREAIYAFAMAAIFDPVYGSDFSGAATQWNELLGLRARDIMELVGEAIRKSI